MSLGSITFDALYANTDLRCTILLSTGDTINALCAGVQNLRLDSDQGMGDILQALVRIKTDNRTDTGMAKGDELTLTDSEGDVYKVMITGTKQASGLYTMLIKAVDE